MPAFDRQASGHFLRWLIAGVQRAHRRRAAAARALWAAASAVTALTVCMIADAAYGWAEGGRLFVYPAIAAAALAAVAGIALAAWMRIPSALYVARLIESRRPELRNALMTFVELESDPACPERAEAAEDPSLAAAVGRQATRSLSRADPGDFVSAGGIRLPAVAAATACGLLAAVLWMGQGVFFRPWIATAEAGPTAGKQATTPPALAAITKPAESVHPAAAAANPSEAIAAAIEADREKLERLAEALAATPSAGSVRQAHGPSTSRTGQAASAGSQAGPKSDAGNTPGTACAGQGAPDQRGGAGRGQAIGPAGGQVAGSASGGAESSASGATGHAARAGGTDQAAAGGQGPEPQSGIADQGAGGNSAGTGRSEAAGAMAGSGGSAGGEATAARQGGADGPPPAPGGWPQTADFPQNALDAMRRVRRLIEEADGRIRDGEVNDAFLGRIGMTSAEFHRFVAAWERTLETASPEAESAASACSGQAANVSVAAGAVAAARGELIRPETGSESRPVLGAAAAPDGGDLVQGGDARVSRRLRPAVAAYFEAAARLAAGKNAKVGER